MRTSLRKALRKLREFVTMRPRRETLSELAVAHAEGERLLGVRGWMLLTCEGKLIGGPYFGSYVSSRPSAEQVAYAHALLEGETLSIHLMHRHLGGKRHVSSLRWRAEGLVMVYSDRQELA
ncbi:hypothetical protein DES41_104618 [Pseudorhodoferax soli]|uniref:Uncharacterized protein n=1 Tax=Pseudorhodoferax soli TaxID=545864 RepID=A0A368XXN1_9BURK|nr:hypothetical protein DES41_104618 [Pseudorhodoferax soli]